MVCTLNHKKIYYPCAVQRVNSFQSLHPLIHANSFYFVGTMYQHPQHVSVGLGEIEHRLPSINEIYDMVVDQMRRLRLSHLIGESSVEIPYGPALAPPRRPKWLASLFRTKNEELACATKETPNTTYPYRDDMATKRDQHAGSMLEEPYQSHEASTQPYSINYEVVE